MGSGTIAAELGERLAPASGPLPEAVRKEASRSLLNVLATAVGASRHPAVDAVLAVGRRLGAPEWIPVPGREELTDRHHAALATGVAAHLDDFDDTHLATVIHPGAAPMSALLPLAAEGRAGGEMLLKAFALGMETELRIGYAMSPWHYDEGWHITGTVGAIGAAAAAGVLLGLPAPALSSAIALAAANPLGHRESFGTMEKSFHPGKAAAWGLRAATLAEAGADADLAVFEGPSGYFGLLSGRTELGRILEGWGDSWQTLANTYKPYPCGIVCHPVIDAGVAVSGRLKVAEITEVIVHCNPLVVELTGNPAPLDGLEARFSTIHAVAAGIADGRVGLAQYADERVAAPDLVRLRGLTRLVEDEAIPRDAARLEVRLRDGGRLEESVAHARGSLERPLTDAELLEKAEGLVDAVLPGRTPELAAAVGGLAEEGGVARLLRALVPR